MQYLISGLAEYVAALNYDQISFRAKEVAKQAILDSYGNMVFGCYSDASQKILAYADAADSLHKNEDTVALLGRKNKRTSLDNAVFTHTMLARCADLDDGYRHAMGHPGSGLVPLLCSAAELYQKDGREMITALVAAYDIYARLGEAINPFMYRERGFDATGVCGAVAAAALLAKLKGESGEVIRNSMGLASLFTGGLIEYQNDGTSGKILCSGWGALTGIRAVRLAECGFTGPLAALEGKYGFFQAFKGTSGYCDTSKVLTALGEDFKITSIYFKRHACQRGLHAALDAVLELKMKYQLTPADIKSLLVKTSTFVLRLSNPEPKTAVGAQASIQFTSAITMKYGRIDSEKLIFESFDDPEIKNLVQKIKVVKDETVQNYLVQHPTHFGAARLVVETTNGHTYDCWSPVPLGDVETPLDWNALKLKFEHLVEETPANKDKDKIFDLIQNLERQKDIGGLLKFLF